MIKNSEIALKHLQIVFLYIMFIQQIDNFDHCFDEYRCR